MIVHITSTPEFSTEVLTEVVSILNQVPGELEFILDKPLTTNQCSLINPRLKEIEKVESLSFDDFFNLCNTHRVIKEILEDEFVVIVTSIRNVNRWFSAFDKKNIFVDGIGWEYYTKRDSKYGIAYQILENIFQSQIELNINDISNEPNIHLESIGCINDMCSYKPDVMLKLRTADICDSCIDRAIEKNINPLVFEHIKESIENLRKEFVNSNRIKSTVKPLNVKVDPDRSIYIGSKTIEVPHLSKVLFIFFLKNPKGIETKLVCEHQDELLSIYREVRQNALPESIKGLFEPAKGSKPTFDTTKYRLNKALVEQLGGKLAEYYIITNVEIKDGNNIYKINLEEDYITIEPKKKKNR